MTRLRRMRSFTTPAVGPANAWGSTCNTTATPTARGAAGRFPAAACRWPALEPVTQFADDLRAPQPAEVAIVTHQAPVRESEAESGSISGLCVEPHALLDEVYGRVGDGAHARGPFAQDTGNVAGLGHDLVIRC